MKDESPDERRDRYRRADEFVLRVLAVAPDLTEAQIENIRRASAGDLPTYLQKTKPQATDLG
jgi:hypothetical protein